jgi:hypothetical protein
MLTAARREAGDEEVDGRSLLDGIAREGARRMLLAALEAEVAAYLEAHATDRDAAGLSATNIARLTNDWEVDYRAFQKRECQRALGFLPCLGHPLIDALRKSPIDQQAEIFCASHTMLARRDISRTVVPPLGLLHRRELRYHDSFDRPFTLKELEWPVRREEPDVEPHEGRRDLFPICL